jgi:predicted nuclease of predicted toxin-antitoxin system
MRILLDESLPAELRPELPSHEVRTVQELGWSGLKNGELLARSAGRFDVFLTADQNLQYQQNLSALPVAIVVLAARSNRIADLRPLMPKLLRSLKTLQARTLVQIGQD